MNQNYISNILYHFIGRSIESEDEKYKLMTKILKEGWLTFPPHENSISPGQIHVDSFKERKINEMFNPKCVCFSDIPNTNLKIHMEKYSKFGIGFSKSFLIERGANPVFYIEENSLTYKRNYSTNMLELTKKVDYYQENCSKAMWYFISRYLPYCQKSVDEVRDTWEVYLFLTDVFSYFKVWNSYLEDNDPDNYYFEREWRAINNIKFQLSDILTILIPKDYEKRLREDFPEYTRDIVLND